MDELNEKGSEKKQDRDLMWEVQSYHYRYALLDESNS